MLEPAKTYLFIGLGSALGGMSRFWLSGLVAQRWGETFPWGTLIVNLTGSMLIGLLAGFSQPDSRLFLQPSLRQFLMIGLCGGYTTFSSFSLQTLNLVREGQWFYAVGNVLLSVALCLIGVWLGHIVAQWVNR